MKIEMTKHEAFFVLKLVEDYVNDLAESTRRREKLGEDMSELKKRLDKMDAIRRRIYCELIDS